MGFELLLFSTDPAVIEAGEAGGVSGFIVDREEAGKRERQAGFDTQINTDTVADLLRVRGATDATVICRVNGMADPERCLREIEEAHAAGADEILLPMVTGVREVEAVLGHRDRIGGPAVGILIETAAAVELASELGRLPLRRVYVGLNDLAIDRGLRNIFVPLVDGTVESVRAQITVPFGVAGLTLPDCGDPIPCHLLMSEMTRLRCDFTFLRRSFFADGKQLGYEAAAKVIGRAVATEQQRPAAELEREHRRLVEAVENAPDRDTWRPLRADAL